MAQDCVNAMKNEIAASVLVSLVTHTIEAILISLRVYYYKADQSQLLWSAQM